MLDHSFGIIAYYLQGNTICFLFVWEEIQAYWCFPKGHGKTGESPLTTAKRKFREETGLTAKSITTQSNPLSQSYRFRHQGRIIKKEVTYFLAQVNPRTQTTGPRTMRWMTLNEFAKVAKHQSILALARQASAMACEA